MTVQEFYRNPAHWCKHALVNARGQRCLEGALILCYGDYSPAMVEAKRKVERALVSSGWNLSIVAFNDAYGVTVERVQQIVEQANV